MLTFKHFTKKGSKVMAQQQNRSFSVFFTDRVRSTTVRYCFHRCLSLHTSGEGGTPARSSQEGVPQPSPARGHLPRVPHGQVRMGGTPAWGTPAWGTPPTRSAHGVFDKRQSVCLLRSRRRTVLSQLLLKFLNRVILFKNRSKYGQ